ncbi:MAG: 16S rRNA (cytidine(1402)-2'-O)-methyltransferase [Chloroflexi bacterium]|nr:16S rRNA (cytidine(1402)-2'-O)-methyltransferase [Chloroflexota bacterium]
MGTLFVVATPIGNLEDISLRALRVLREAGLVAAEDTRSTKHLLSRYDIHTPVTSYFEHNKLSKLEAILAATREGDVALVSEAGMPGISDPGYELVRAALERGIPVVPVPGPSAGLAALAVSGLPTDQYVYLGFLPRKGGERRRSLAEVANEPRTLVAYEAPHRLLSSLEDALAALGDRPMAAARELTKLHEEVARGSISEVLAHFRQTEPRGEFTLVFAGRAREEAASEPEVARARLAELRAAGRSGRAAVDQVVGETGLPRRQVYRLWLELERAQREYGR